jgi:aspartyl aminopeptidase
MNAVPGLKEFLDASPTVFHAAETIASYLDNLGFSRLDEKDEWKLLAGRGYYVLRGNRAVIAFIPGEKPPWESGFRIAAAHLDSPLLKLKVEAASCVEGICRLPVEPYGSPVFQSWLDRELEIAGIITCRTSSTESDAGPEFSGNIRYETWRSQDNAAIIPSLAIHLNREVNKGQELNPQTHMAALMLRGGNGGDDSPELNPLIGRICGDLNISPENYLASELFLIPAEGASLVGNGEDALIVSGRLDNLAMSHALIRSIPKSGERKESGIMAMWFDAEEVGSRTSTGAFSLFPDEIIERVVLSFGGNRENLLRCRRKSFLVSADMAHAVHPNYKDRHDASYSPEMGKGPVLKSHGQKHYATDVFSESRIRNAALSAGIRLQKLIFRSDTPCGSTVGPISEAGLSIETVDIGNPLWSMHSCRETASLSDHEDMIKLLKECWKF